MSEPLNLVPRFREPDGGPPPLHKGRLEGSYHTKRYVEGAVPYNGRGVTTCCDGGVKK